jgi:hypothetical protein
MIERKRRTHMGKHFFFLFRAGVSAASMLGAVGCSGSAEYGNCPLACLDGLGPHGQYTSDWPSTTDGAGATGGGSVCGPDCIGVPMKGDLIMPDCWGASCPRECTPKAWRLINGGSVIGPSFKVSAGLMTTGGAGDGWSVPVFQLLSNPFPCDPGKYRPGGIIPFNCLAGWMPVCVHWSEDALCSCWLS